MAVPQPITAESNAVPQPRRLPKSRRDSNVVTTARTMMRSARRRDGHGMPPTHGGASAPHKLRPDWSSTSATSSRRGWSRSALSSWPTSEAVATSSKAKS